MQIRKRYYLSNCIVDYGGLYGLCCADVFYNVFTPDDLVENLNEHYLNQENQFNEIRDKYYQSLKDNALKASGSYNEHLKRYEDALRGKFLFKEIDPNETEEAILKDWADIGKRLLFEKYSTRSKKSNIRKMRSSVIGLVAIFIGKLSEELNEFIVGKEHGPFELCLVDESYIETVSVANEYPFLKIEDRREALRLLGVVNQRVSTTEKVQLIRALMKNSDNPFTKYAIQMENIVKFGSGGIETQRNAIDRLN